jgi:PIN domain nuclease of toxin-antitoxin system
LNGYLLDTNVALLAGFRSAALSASVRRAIQRGPNHLSVVSYWEVMLKSSQGRLEVGDPRSWWRSALEQLAATPLLLRAEHVDAIYELPPLHQDPFDRVLIAQATVEELALVTTDREIPKYASARLKITR